MQLIVTPGQHVGAGTVPGKPGCNSLLFMMFVKVTEKEPAPSPIWTSAAAYLGLPHNSGKRVPEDAWVTIVFEASTSASLKV